MEWWAEGVGWRVFGLGGFGGAGRVAGGIFVGRAAPDGGGVGGVPFFPRGGEFADERGILCGDVAGLAGIGGEVEELPAALRLGFEIAPVGELPLAAADGALRAEAPEQVCVRRGGERRAGAEVRE